MNLFVLIVYQKSVENHILVISWLPNLGSINLMESGASVLLPPWFIVFAWENKSNIAVKAKQYVSPSNEFNDIRVNQERDLGLMLNNPIQI